MEIGQTMGMILSRLTAGYSCSDGEDLLSNSRVDSSLRDSSCQQPAASRNEGSPVLVMLATIGCSLLHDAE